jgi:serine/threonine protein phosphatase PrpC
MHNPGEADTVEIPALDAAEGARWPDTGSSQVEVDLAALSHPGLVRPQNEDHYAVVRFGRSLETLSTNLPVDEVPKRAEEIAYGMVVADGIGGAAAGEQASRMAITMLYSLVLHTPDWIFSTGDRATEQVLQRTAERYQKIDAALRDQGISDPRLQGMGTTMTLACSLGSNLIIGHIGDSRAYLFHEGELHQLTRDHNLVQSLVDLGRITEAQAAKHPFRHMLTRALGAGKHRVEGDFQRAVLAGDDQLLLCTDGLTDMVDNASIASTLGSAATADDACQKLVASALDKGGKDNVTVALARYQFPS